MLKIAVTTMMIRVKLETMPQINNKLKKYG